ncbi:hypothetical protein AAFF_G00346840 [Aldrovandia affinis]|uniref:Microtubule-associated protein 6 n=1 Tax=Aldrovandia affinis TaxID=143900 RepID=A0AAD7SJM2_9TELE|nr:hypothetical protein AAFF_G00346840 [Aldrovandia affinis]
MAWPCITRACCINRFWSDFDKADIAVPLVFTKYSDVTEVQRLHLQPQPKQLHPQARASAVAIETQPPHREQEAVARAPPVAGAAAAGEPSSGSVTRQDFKAWKVRPEPSCKPKNEYHPSETPFNNETQYQKDFKAWPIPRRGDHPWIPKPSLTGNERPQRPKSAPAPTDDESGVEKSEIADKVQEKDMKERKKKQVKKEKVAERRVSIKIERKEPAGVAVEGKGRAAADALNRQIKQEVTSGSSYRNEFKAYTDVKPVKPIKAKSQYKPLIEDKTSLETSYSATFRGEQGKQQSTDNKALERRRIRSLYSEPGKEPHKTEKPSVPRSKPKRTTTTTSGHGKLAKKAKEKQVTSVRGAKKKSAESTDARPEEGSKEKSKEINNKLAEAKE